MSFSEWKTYQISELGKVVTGKTPPTKDKENFGNEYPFITPVDMNGQKTIYKTERNLSEIGISKVKNFLLPKNAVCTSCIGSDLGKVVKTSKPSVTNQQINSIVCNDKFDSDFVYYSLKLLSPTLKNIGHQSTAVPIINKTDFSKFEIEAPENKITQQRIASILSSLDDAIELNQQINKTLEEMAKAIFKEWFVDFNFHNATGKFQETEIGKIPVGWKVATFEDVFDADRGLSYKGAGLAESDATPMHNLNSVLEGGGYKTIGIKFYNGEYKDKHIVNAGEVIVANTEQGHKHLLIGYPAIVPQFYGEHGIFSHHIYRLRPKANCYLSPDYIYHLLLQTQVREQVIGFANGTTVNMLKIEGLKKPKFAMPPKELAEKFGAIAKANRLQAEQNIEENQSLSNLRDTLLPKLMKGEININL
jgi:type I restriction enzyme, S subunit